MIIDRLLAVARQARDRVDFKIKSGLDLSASSAQERAELVLLIEEVEAAGRSETGDQFAARQHLQTVDVQAAALANLMTAYDALELAARVVVRVAKEGDPVELLDVLANLDKVIRAQAMKQELSKRAPSPDGADAFAYAAAAVQVDIGLKPFAPRQDDGEAFKSSVRDFARRSGWPFPIK